MTWTGFSCFKIQVQCAVCSCGICERFPASRISRVVKWSSSRTYSIDTQNRFCVLWNRHSGSAAINRCTSHGLPSSQMVCCMFWNRHSGSAVKRWVQAVSTYMLIWPLCQLLPLECRRSRGTSHIASSEPWNFGGRLKARRHIRKKTRVE
jgi:hypothetical protein